MAFQHNVKTDKGMNNLYKLILIIIAAILIGIIVWRLIDYKIEKLKLDHNYIGLHETCKNLLNDQNPMTETNNY